MRKKTILLIILLISLFMIGTVSATTNSTTHKINTKITDKTNHKETIKKDNTIKDKVSITYTGNFEDLSKAINNTKKGGTLNLQKNYKYKNSSRKGILINKSIIINGNGHTIDGNKQSRIFNVNSGVHLILKNLNLNNGNRTLYEDPEDIFDCDYGGVISTYSGRVTAINCTFANANEGGAIYGQYSKITMTKCTFINNTAELGAIYADYVNLTNCVFTNNNGGAIRTIASGIVTANSCVFTNNNASHSGGAISGEKVYVNNCVFTNTSDSAISAIELTVNNSKFSNNNAKYGGGAIDAGEVNATNCVFSKNTADYGGAIEYYSGKLTVTNCVFIDNIARDYGGAIDAFPYWREDIKNNITVINCTFNKNSAEKGGAIYIANNSDVKIVNSRFINNNAKKNKDSSGIYITEYISDMFVKKTNFKGDSIYCEFLCNLKLINTKVKVNKKSYINVIPDSIDFGSNIRIIFKSNKRYNVGVYIDGEETLYRKTKTINKCIKNLQAGKHTIKIKLFRENNGAKVYYYSKSFKIKVIKVKTKITAKPQIYKAQIKTKKYKIILKNKQNKPIKSAKVTLKIGKKTYPAKTNTKGVAIFKINKLTKKGKYTATITYKGDKKYNKAIKKVKIIVK